MLHAVADRQLDEILSRVSRSFYLSLAILPAAVRAQLSAAYLVARAADTIADTEVVRADRRRELLAALRDEVEGGGAAGFAETVRRELSGVTDTDAERLLLERLGDCLAIVRRTSPDDRARIARVLSSLVTGMERDLARFPAAANGEPTAIASEAELDEHCYLAAGCVGEFWTEMTAAHLPVVAHLARPEPLERGVRLGKALQMVNVIRDAPKDLRAGRCYVPRPLLERHRLAPRDLLDPVKRLSAAPLWAELRAIALAHLDAAWPYVQAIPRRAPRLRLACVWPLWIGLATLAAIRQAEDPLDPLRPVKIDRRSVYRIVAESSSLVAFPALLERAHRRRRAMAGDLVAR